MSCYHFFSFSLAGDGGGSLVFVVLKPVLQVSVTFLLSRTLLEQLHPHLLFILPAVIVIAIAVKVQRAMATMKEVTPVLCFKWLNFSLGERIHTQKD